MPKGLPTHVAIDNSDGRQQTLSALATPHHKNTTTYVPKVQSFLLIVWKMRPLIHPLLHKTLSIISSTKLENEQKHPC